jgi:hypothetical protein
LYLEREITEVVYISELVEERIKKGEISIIDKSSLDYSAPLRE